MRIVLFFDLPSVSNEDKMHYRHFRKFLIKNGFISMQESVYSKIVLNLTSGNNMISRLEKNKPPSGLVQIMMITEKQYADMRYLVGEYSSPYISDDRRLVILDDEE